MRGVVKLVRMQERLTDGVYKNGVIPRDTDLGRVVLHVPAFIRLIGRANWLNRNSGYNWEVIVVTLIKLNLIANSERGGFYSDSARTEDVVVYACMCTRGIGVSIPITNVAWCTVLGESVHKRTTQRRQSLDDCRSAIILAIRQ